MSKFTGILGTKASQLGNFVLGVGLSTAASTDEAVTSSISVTETITPVILPSPLRKTVSDAITVTQTISHQRDVNRTVTHSISVTPAITFVIDSRVRLTEEVLEIIYAINPLVHLTGEAVEVIYRKPISISLTDSIGVTQSIKAAGDRQKTVVDTITVSQTITPRGLDNLQTVSHAISVAQSITSRSTVVRLTVTSPISVTPAIRNNGDVHITVTDHIAVTQTPTFRNTVVRITVADVIGVGSPGAGTSDHEVVDHPLTCTTIASARSDHPRLTVTSNVAVNSIVSFVSPRLTVTSEISVSQTISTGNTVNRQTVTSAIAVNQTINERSNPVRLTVIDTITIPQNFPQIWPATGRNDHNRQTVTSSIAVSDAFPGGNSRREITVTDNVSVAQQVRSAFQHQTVGHTIVVSQAIGGQQKSITVTDAIRITDLVSFRHTPIRQTVTDAIIVTTVRTARTPQVPETVTDAVHVSQKITSRIAPRTLVITDSIHVTQTIVVGGNRNLTVTDQITVTPTFRDREVRQRVTDSIHVDDRMRTIWLTVHDHVSVTQKAYTIYNESIVDTLPLTQSVGRQVTRQRGIVQDLPMVETVRRGAIWTRSLTDTLIFPEVDFQRQYSFWPYPFTVPVVHGGLMDNLVILKCGSDTITLPAAVLGDATAPTDKITVQRSMNARTMTIIQTNDRQKLKLNFRVSLKKSLELRKFVIANIAGLIQLTDWNGAVWVGRFMSNPFALEHAGRSVTEQEFVTFEIDFEGAKVSG